VDEGGVEDGAPDVVLELVPGPVADPDRARVLVAGEVVQPRLGEVALAVDAVQICRSCSLLVTSRTKLKKSLASQSKPSV
jgi:hypothetical protein